MVTYNIIQIKIVSNSFLNYSYIVVDKETNQAVLIDPSWDYSEAVKLARKMKFKISAILLTHLHIDHIFSVQQFVQEYPNTTIYLSKKESEYYGCDYSNISLIEDEEVIYIGKTEICCLVTPGHTKGSACYLFDRDFFTGDTVFAEGCGICSCVGGSAFEMYESFQRLKKRIRPDIKVFAAHSYGQSQGVYFGELLQSNIYFQINDVEQFVLFRNRKKQPNPLNFK